MSKRDEMAAKQFLKNRKTLEEDFKDGWNACAADAEAREAQLTADINYWTRRAAEAESGDCDNRIFKDLYPKIEALKAREAQLVELVRELIFSHEQLEAGFAGMWGKPGIEWHEDAMATAPKWIANQLEEARAKLTELNISTEELSDV